MASNVGYARVSSSGQSLEVQLEKLNNCNKIFQEKISGSSINRYQLKACLEYVREGDTLVITKLDRLARSTLDLCNIAAALERKQVNLLVLDQNIDTNTSTGRLLFNMLGAISQFETEIRSERQADGIAKAKELGTKFGRSNKLDYKQVLDMITKREKGVIIKELMREYKISKASVYRYLTKSNG